MAPSHPWALQLAVAGRAVALVNGDRDLLVLIRVGRCPVSTPDAFLASGLMPTIP